MWNLTELDTSTTTNQRSYFRSGVTPIASSTTRNTFSPVIRPRTSPHRHMPRATPRAICPITRPRQSRMQFPNRSDSAARTNTNRQDARGELHAKLLSCTTVSGRPRPEAAAGPGHSHQNHRRRRCGERRQGQSKHTRTKPRSIGGRRGACGAWPGFETTRRAKLAARTASGRAGHAAAGDLAGRAMPEIRRTEQHRRSGGQPQQAAPRAATAQ